MLMNRRKMGLYQRRLNDTYTISKTLFFSMFRKIQWWRFHKLFSIKSPSCAYLQTECSWHSGLFTHQIRFPANYLFRFCLYDLLPPSAFSPSWEGQDFLCDIMHWKALWEHEDSTQQLPGIQTFGFDPGWNSWTIVFLAFNLQSWYQQEIFSLKGIKWQLNYVVVQLQKCNQLVSLQF